MKATRQAYTTGQVAKMFGVSIPTIIKWYNDNLLKGFLLPGSQARRITKKSIAEFAAEYGYPSCFDGTDEAEEPDEGKRMEGLEHAN